MNHDFLISKNDAENVQKIFLFYKEAVEHVDKLKKIRDPAIEKIYQNGVRPKSGLINNPDDLYKEKVHIWAMIKNVMPKLVPEDNYGILKPAATLYEWLFKRLCLDLKGLANVTEECMGVYICIIDEGVKEFQKDINEVRAKYPEMNDDFSVEKFVNLNPDQRHYFVARLNYVTFEALSSILKVILMQWYPDKK